MKYETIIGVEVHIELSTKTKIFCGCSASFGAPANTHVCPVCLGMPGALPALNRQVVTDALAVALALNCEINRRTGFDRKNYFYPDNPQNYQISQLYTPIGVNGVFEGRIRIHELHMEEDAGKLIHDETTGDTLVDYNRAGVPLIEIVTEPDMRNADEVVDFLMRLRTMLLFLGVSDCRMNEGSLRADVNLSVRRTDCVEKDVNREPHGGTQHENETVPDSYTGDENGAFGTRTEMKNLNSFKAIRRAIEAERDRQIAVLENGGTVIQETRRWDDENETSHSMRSKEDAKDYRYFPEPDLLTILIEEDWIDEVKQNLPELPEEKRKRYREEFGLPEYDIGILTTEKVYADLFEKTVRAGADPKKASNWLMGETMRLMKERRLEPEELRLNPEELAVLIRLTENKTINTVAAKEIFAVLFSENIDVGDYVTAHGLAMLHDEEALERLVKRIVDENPGAVADYRAGKKKAAGFIVGQVMRETKGRANPETVGEKVTEALEKAGQS